MRAFKMEYRINGFDQIKAFYSIVFEQKHEIRPQHISLYVFLINQNNRNNWVEWFKCPFDLAMAGACIGNKKTYYKCLSDLQDWGLIKYEKGINDYKAPKVKIEVLNHTATDTATVPQSEPLLQPQGIPLPTPQDTHIYKPITDKPKTKNQKKRFVPPTISECIEYFKKNGYTEEAAKKAFNYYDCADWIDSKGNAVRNWKQKMQSVWFKEEHKIKIPKADEPLSISKTLNLYLIPNDDHFGYDQKTLYQRCLDGKYSKRQ